MEQYVDVSLLHSKLAVNIHDALSTYKESMTDKLQQTVFRIHFPATRNLFVGLSASYPYTKQAFKDMYLDTLQCDLTSQGLWYKQRYNFDNETACFSLSETSLKSFQPRSTSFSIISAVAPEAIKTIEKKFLPFAAYTCLRHTFATEFGYMRIEEVSFAPHIAFLFATAIVEDCAKFEDYCAMCPEVSGALKLAPVAIKIIERIKVLKERKLPKHIDPLWTALLESRAVPTGEWSAEICRFNPFISGFPISPNDDFWKRKGKMVLSPEELGAL